MWLSESHWRGTLGIADDRLLTQTLRYKQMEGACWEKEDASGNGACLLQWSQLSVLAVPVIALTTDSTLTRRAHAEKGLVCWCMTTMSFHSSKLLRIHTAMSAGTTWPNTICITGKFIQTTMTKLKLFNYQSHPVLHAGIAQALTKRLCFLSSLEGGCDVLFQSHCNLLNALLLMCFSNRYSSTFFSITSTGHLRVTG